MKKPKKPPRFAKLFDTARGQILIVLHLAHEDGPRMEVWADPNVPGLAICSTAFSYLPGRLGEKTARGVFDSLDDAGALKAATPLFELADKLTAKD